MKKVILIVLLVVVVAGLSVGGWVLYERLHSPDDGPVTLYGNVEVRDAQLAFEVQQTVAEVLVEEGDRVAAGQLLARLDTRQFAAEVASREAMVGANAQIVRRLKNGTRPQEVAQAKANVNDAEVGLANAKRTLDRLEKTRKSGATSEQDLDDAQAAFDQAQAQLNVQKEALDLAEAGPREEEVAEAEARLRDAEAQLELARNDLDDATLYAPSDGVIRARILELGENASPQRPAFTLALIDPKWVRAYLPESQLGKVRPGASARVFSDSYPGRPYDGWVGFISPEAEFTPKNVQSEELRTALVYEVRVYVDDPNGELRLGMPVTVELDDRPAATTRPTTRGAK